MMHWNRVQILRLFAVFACVMIKAGCASLQTIAPITQTIDEPSLNETQSVNLGDPIVRKGFRNVFPAVRLERPLAKAPGFTMGYEIKPQRLTAVYENKSHVFYEAERMIQRDVLTGAAPVGGGICLSKYDPNVAGVYLELGRCMFGINPDLVSPTTVTARASPGVVQELIYNGRIGDSVRFLYREFAQDIARPAFSQEVQYDLRQSDEVGFKDVRIRILDATNTQLDYVVLETFVTPSP